MTLEYEGYLAHYGVKGQKWGVRRYQDEEGEYTSEGRRRYGFAPKRRDPPPYVMDEYRRMPSPRERMRKEREQVQQAILEERKVQAQRIIAAGAVVTIAAIVAARKGGTAILNKMRSRYAENWLKSRSAIARNNQVVGEFAKARAEAYYDTRRKAAADFIRQRGWR